MKHLILHIVVTQIISASWMTTGIGEEAAREVSFGMIEASKNMKYGVEAASKTMGDGIGVASKTVKDGIEEASKNMRDGIGVASKTMKDGIEVASKNMKDGIEEVSKTMKDGMEHMRYFGYETVNLLLHNPWIRLLIFIECCYAALKTLQIAEQLKFNWRSVLPITIVIVGLTIVWPLFRVIGFLIVVLTSAILFIYRRSFSYPYLLQRLFS